MAEIGIHDDDKIAICMFDAVYVSGAQTQFGTARLQHNLIIAVDYLQLLGHVQCSVRTAIIDDNNFEVNFTTQKRKRKVFQNITSVNFHIFPSLRATCYCNIIVLF